MIIICGLPKGETLKYRCPVCTYESDDIEEFATTCCWECAFK